jgi:hypothetical protein
MDWDVVPEPADEAERAALLSAAAQALAPETDSAWWRSGLEDLDGGATAEQAWHDAGAGEP